MFQLILPFQLELPFETGAGVPSPTRAKPRAEVGAGRAGRRKRATGDAPAGAGRPAARRARLTRSEDPARQLDLEAREGCHG